MLVIVLFRSTTPHGIPVINGEECKFMVILIPNE